MIVSVEKLILSASFSLQVSWGPPPRILIQPTVLCIGSKLKEATTHRLEFYNYINSYGSFWNLYRAMSTITLRMREMYVTSTSDSAH